MRFSITETMALAIIETPPRKDVLIERDVAWIYRGDPGLPVNLARVHDFIEKTGVSKSRLNYYAPEGNRTVSVKDMTEAELFLFGRRYAQYHNQTQIDTRWALEALSVHTRFDWFRTALMYESMKMLASIQI